MTDSIITWVHAVVEGGLLIGMFRFLVVVGKMMQKQEDHDRRIDRLEDKVFQ